MRAAIGVAAVLGLAGLIAGLLWLTPGSDDDGAGDEELSEVLDEIAEAVSRDGEILHSTVSATQGTRSPVGMELWVSGQRGAIRFHFAPDGIALARTDMLVVDGYAYARDPHGPATREVPAECEGVGPWLAVLIFCDANSEYSVEIGTWDGAEARVIVGERTIIIPTPADLTTPRPTEGSGDGLPEIRSEESLGGVETIVSRLYVDPTLNLPIAWTQEQRLNGEPVDDLGDPVLVYKHEFLPLTDDLADMFDPSLFGYEEE